jgi:hypothetical protein
LSVGKCLVDLGVGVGQRLGIFGLGQPPREGVRNRIQGRAGRLLYRHGYRENAWYIRGPGINAIDVVSRVVVFGILHRLDRLDARRQAVHLRFGVELGHRLIASLGSAASANANELPDRGQRHAQYGDRQDHLQKRKPASCSRSQGRQKAHKVLWG